MSAGRLWDISQTLRPGLPVWPGDTPFTPESRWSMADGGPVNVGAFRSTVHAGAHADAPLHYAAGGLSIGEVGLQPYLGPCRLVDARAAGAVIDVSFLEDLADSFSSPSGGSPGEAGDGGSSLSGRRRQAGGPPPALRPYSPQRGERSLDGAWTRMLFRTFAAFPHEAWPGRFTTISAAAVAWLAGRGTRLIGLDSPSLDPEDSKTMAAHQAVLAHDIRVLEGLVLDEPPPGIYELIAPPLKLAGLDASPVRAVLREIAA